MVADIKKHKRIIKKSKTIAPNFGLGRHIKFLKSIISPDPVDDIESN